MLGRPEWIEPTTAPEAEELPLAPASELWVTGPAESRLGSAVVELGEGGDLAIGAPGTAGSVDVPDKVYVIASDAEGLVQGSLAAEVRLMAPVGSGLRDRYLQWVSAGGGSWLAWGHPVDLGVVWLVPESVIADVAVGGELAVEADPAVIALTGPGGSTSFGRTLFAPKPSLGVTLVVGAPGPSNVSGTGRDDPGAVWVVHELPLADASVAEVGVQVVGSERGQGFGRSVVAIEAADGQALLVVASALDSSNNREGRVEVIRAPQAGQGPIVAEPDLALSPGAGGQVAAVGDLDGDGVEDFAAYGLWRWFLSVGTLPSGEVAPQELGVSLELGLDDRLGPDGAASPCGDLVALPEAGSVAVGDCAFLTRKAPGSVYVVPAEQLSAPGVIEAAAASITVLVDEGEGTGGTLVPVQRGLAVGAPQHDYTSGDHDNGALFLVPLAALR